MVKYVDPIALNISKSSVEEFTSDIAEILGFKPGDDLGALVAKLGGKIVTGSTGYEDMESGSLIAHSLSDFTIYLSPLTSIARDRFTIAHELGHLFLHLPNIQKNDSTAAMRATRYIKSDSPEDKRIEWEANWFAAAFLMPAEEFKKQYYEGGIDRIKTYFKVSEPAAKARAETLKLS